MLWAQRVRQSGWQFPQGGIHKGESPEQALYRELHEEVGLSRGDVDVLGSTRSWLRYRLPARLIRPGDGRKCIGQKQKWFLLQLRCGENSICVDHTPSPEFDQWRWVSYWYPLGQVVSFKREVYRRALKELSHRYSRNLFQPLLLPNRPDNDSL